MSNNMPASTAPISWAILDAYNTGHVNETTSFNYGFLVDKDDDILKQLIEAFPSEVSYESVEDGPVLFTTQIDLSEHMDIYKKYTMGVKGPSADIAYITSSYTPKLIASLYPSKTYIMVLPIFELEPVEGSRVDFIRGLFGDSSDIPNLKYLPIEFLNTIEHSFPALINAFDGRERLEKIMMEDINVVKAIMELLMDSFEFNFNVVAGLPFNDLSFIPLEVVVKG